MVQTSSPSPPTVVVHRDCVARVGDCVCRAACVHIAVIVDIVGLKERRRRKILLNEIENSPVGYS